MFFPFSDDQHIFVLVEHGIVISSWTWNLPMFGMILCSKRVMDEVKGIYSLGFYKQIYTN